MKPAPASRLKRAPPPIAGYSGTPLWKKLGVRDNQTTWRLDMPESVAQEIAAGDAVPALLARPRPSLAMAHLFVTRRAELALHLEKLRGLLAPDGTVWISWPKKTPPKGVTPVPTDITEDTIRAEALPLGFVDVKVCAIDATWSGLKLVIRKSERPK
ncbi:MAG TPA: DUF3052 domain-containing protein [Acidobacteriaceae bacterium]|jgi:hypothetical protein|nr:DUF3052 domain-containing protein [Acidobacteriaceae bacterium]